MFSLTIFLLHIYIFINNCWCSHLKSTRQENIKLILDRILDHDIYDAKLRPSGYNGTGMQQSRSFNDRTISTAKTIGNNMHKCFKYSWESILAHFRSVNVSFIILADSATVVIVNIFFRSISTIDDDKMEYSVEMTFRELWSDGRLQFRDFEGQVKYLVITDPSMIWMPDVFIENERSGHIHHLIQPNMYIKIFPDGTVLHSVRISLTLSCPMDLRLYPLDRQVCVMRISSYSYTTDDLIFLWKFEEPIQIVRNLQLPRFTFEKHLTDFCTLHSSVGEYSCLKISFLFKREFAYYVIQIYIPCCMLVIVSWMSFWLDQDAVPARVALGVTTILTMTTQTTGINAALPPVNYTKAIDVWLAACLAFVFGALIEFAILNFVSRSDQELKKPSALVGSILTLEGGCAVPLEAKRILTCCNWLSNYPSRSKRIDIIARIAFPIAFLLFNLSYWSIYLHKVDSAT